MAVGAATSEREIKSIIELRSIRHTGAQGSELGQIYVGLDKPSRLRVPASFFLSFVLLPFSLSHASRRSSRSSRSSLYSFFARRADPLTTGALLRSPRSAFPRDETVYTPDTHCRHYENITGWSTSYLRFLLFRGKSEYTVTPRSNGANSRESVDTENQRQCHNCPDQIYIWNTLFIFYV